MYVNWNIWTLVGLLFGAAFPECSRSGSISRWPRPSSRSSCRCWSNLPRLAAALVAGALAYLWRDLPYNLGLLAAVLAGVVVGMALARYRARGGAAQEDAA